MQAPTVPYECDSCPSTCNPVQIPGPPAEPCEPCQDGAPGANAFTTLIASFVMPAIGATVTAEVLDTSWIVSGAGGVDGQPVAVQYAGTFIVTNVVDATHVEIRNDGYTGNAVAGTSIPDGAKISPGGREGGQGSPGSGGAPVDAQYITQTSDPALINEFPMDGQATGLVHNTFGVGIDGVQAVGAGNTNVPKNDGALTTDDAAFGSANGIRTYAAATARTKLGLGTMATQNANNVNITGGTITGVTLPTPSGIPKEIAIYQNRQTSGTNGGSFTGGSWVAAPINTEVVDTGGNGSIAANTVTLAAGTYRATWRVPAKLVDQFQTRLYNVTAGSVIDYGSVAKSASSNDDTSASSDGECRFALAVQSDVQLQARCATTNLTTGFGEAAGFGNTEIYQSVTFVKETP